MNKLIILLLVVSTASGCAGVKFAPANTNEPIPDAWKNRALYPAGVAGYEFQDLVGNVLVIRNSQDPLRVGLIRPDSYENKVIPITDPNNFYRSRIQKGAEAEGAYLAFAAKFSADDMAELTLVDVARAGIVLNDAGSFAEILSKMKAWVASNPKADPNSQRLWVKAVVLSRRAYSSHTKIDSNASGQVGDVTGVKTGVYRKDESTIKSVIIGFEAFDIDELSKQPPALGLTAGVLENLVEKHRFVGLIEGDSPIK